jgi:hypothetical protein
MMGFVGPPSWWEDAKCSNQQTGCAPFFDRDVDVYASLQFCLDCPTRLPCLKSGLEENYGIWGGHSRGERQRILNELDKGASLEQASVAILGMRRKRKQ